MHVYLKVKVRSIQPIESEYIFGHIFTCTHTHTHTHPSEFPSVAIFLFGFTGQSTEPGYSEDL